MWAFYRFEKFFFLSPIDSCLVSFFVHVNNLCFHVRMGWQQLVLPDDILDYDMGALERWEQVSLGMFRDLIRENEVASFLGLSMWHIFLNLWMCLLLGSVSFLSPGPNICSCNPTSFKLDTGLQPTVSLFGYSISLFCLCELSHVVFMVLNFHFPHPPSRDRPHQVRVGVVESSCNTPSVCCNLQIKMFSFHNCLWFIHMIHSSPGRSVKEAELFFVMWPCQCGMIKCLASLVQQLNALGLTCGKFTC